MGIPEFVAFPKIPRLNREIVITEKLDGTNAVIHIGDDDVITAGSRSRWISPEDDNYGFANWVRDNQLELRKLGHGTHFGEWWGAGIQRRYGLTEKRFSLFNVHRWGDEAVRPTCCHVVPTLYKGLLDLVCVERELQRLRDRGSVAAPGFMKPEGIIVFHTAAQLMFKVTLEKDEEPKSKAGGMAKQAAMPAQRTAELTTEETYRAALEKVSALIKSKPGHVDAQENDRWEGAVEWVGIHVDDAYDLGRDAGHWDAKAIADAALVAGAAAGAK